MELRSTIPKVFAGRRGDFEGFAGSHRYARDAA